MTSLQEMQWVKSCESHFSSRNQSLMFLLNVVKKWNYFLQILAELFVNWIVADSLIVKVKITERMSGLCAEFSFDIKVFQWKCQGWRLQLALSFSLASQVSHIIYCESTTNSSQSDTLPVKSPILVKQTYWSYIFGQLKLGYLKQLRYRLRFYIIFLIEKIIDSYGIEIFNG